MNLTHISAKFQLSSEFIPILVTYLSAWCSLHHSLPLSMNLWHFKWLIISFIWLRNSKTLNLNRLLGKWCVRWASLCRGVSPLEVGAPIVFNFLKTHPFREQGWRILPEQVLLWGDLSFFLPCSESLRQHNFIFCLSYRSPSLSTVTLTPEHGSNSEQHSHKYSNVMDWASWSSA